MSPPSRRNRHAASWPFPGVLSSAVSLAFVIAIGLPLPAVSGPSLDGSGAVIDGVDRAPRAKQVRIDAAQREALRRDPLAQPLVERLAANAEMVRVASAGDIDRVRAMLAEGIGPDARDEAGQTALAGAVRSGHVAVARLLLSRGADPDRRGLHGLSPLTLATMRDHGELAALLLRHRADPDRRDSTGHTPLSLAAHLDRPAVIRPLALAGADLQLASRFGPPLVICAEADAARTCTELLRAGADPEVRDDNGRSPLLLAAINENARIARALLAAGAEPGAIVLDWLDR
jgi:ankyrin repeat protein